MRLRQYNFGAKIHSFFVHRFFFLTEVFLIPNFKYVIL
jgi:hypothetical protein